jgi:hypothetical protein
VKEDDPVKRGHDEKAEKAHEKGPPFKVAQLQMKSAA